MSSNEAEPIVLERDKHSLSRKKIDPDALKVLYRLDRNGYKGYLVGGAVRDLLLGKEPKDFDIGTDASPETVRRLFRNSRIIGRRFKINHVYFKGNKIFEVTTFRAEAEEVDETEEVTPLKRDNEYGDARSDALRRDLTINGLFYDIASYSVIDYVGGIEDLENGIVRIIGEPERRIREDPVRMIRAIRHAARTGFEIEPETYTAIRELAEQITLSSPARVHEEIVRDLSGGHAHDAFALFADTGILPHLLPVLGDILRRDNMAAWERLSPTLLAVDGMAARLAGQQPVGIFFAATLIGTVAREDLAGRLPDSICDEILPFFAATAEEIESFPNKPPPFRKLAKAKAMPGKVAGRRASRRKKEKSSLRKALDVLFQPLQLTRRERDVMEDAIRMRYALVSACAEGVDEAPLQLLEQSPLFQSGIRLLRCSAHDSASEMLAFWEERLAARPPREGKGRDDRRRRKRRQRQRRRRANREQPSREQSE